MGITILLTSVVRRIKQSSVFTSVPKKSVHIVHSRSFIFKQLEVTEALNIWKFLQESKDYLLVERNSD